MSLNIINYPYKMFLTLIFKISILTKMNLSNLAIQKAINHDWQEAIKLNQKILNTDPENIDALNRLAQAYYQFCDCKKAEKTYKKVLKHDKFNPIAKRNLEKIQNLKNKNQPSIHKPVKPFNFIEEPGKTKIVSLVSIGDKEVISSLQPCSCLNLNIRTKSISLYCDKSYVGRLPDDIAKRLIWLYKRNNRYTAYIKSIDKTKISVFIKETKKSKHNKNYQSFTNIKPK
jgi:tetratricopeptide (TPR) repeat protein